MPPVPAKRRSCGGPWRSRPTGPSGEGGESRQATVPKGAAATPRARRERRRHDVYAATPRGSPRAAPWGTDVGVLRSAPGPGSRCRTAGRDQQPSRPADRSPGRAGIPAAAVGHSAAVIFLRRCGERTVVPPTSACADIRPVRHAEDISGERRFADQRSAQEFTTISRVRLARTRRITSTGGARRRPEQGPPGIKPTVSWKKPVEDQRRCFAPPFG